MKNKKSMFKILFFLSTFLAIDSWSPILGYPILSYIGSYIYLDFPNYIYMLLSIVGMGFGLGGWIASHGAETGKGARSINDVVILIIGIVLLLGALPTGFFYYLLSDSYSSTNTELNAKLLSGLMLILGLVFVLLPKVHKSKVS